MFGSDLVANGDNSQILKVPIASFSSAYRKRSFCSSDWISLQICGRVGRLLWLGVSEADCTALGTPEMSGATAIDLLEAGRALVQ